MCRACVARGTSYTQALHREWGAAVHALGCLAHAASRQMAAIYSTDTVISQRTLAAWEWCEQAQLASAAQRVLPSGCVVAGVRQVTPFEVEGAAAVLTLQVLDSSHVPSVPIWRKVAGVSDGCRGVFPGCGVPGGWLSDLGPRGLTRLTGSIPVGCCDEIVTT